LIKKLHVIHYAGHTLNDAQVNYIVIEKEFLAVVFSFKESRPYLIGSHVIIFISHAALKHFFQRRILNPD